MACNCYGAPIYTADWRQGFRTGLVAGIALVILISFIVFRKVEKNNDEQVSRLVDIIRKNERKHGD